ncbi:MobA/MobL family protein [Oleiagrimonas sp. MCCC 1A03011]|uniref:MobA/MobL family protein n=1 Tax=Oleiagrimonas sp. MCCC 1A03011 TaxID=1926883 RepID=UPI000DC4310B|nr:MobA/MobL family protein [Oleiagrimonas sp. MCCC 1A03011]RAP55659.1 plasmid mobilization protein [Oleiagrimonas sp. MCCC 1A03011]
MASYHYRIKSGKKGTAVAHASYIAREGKHDSRDDLIYEDFGNMPSWAEYDPREFWRMADKYERNNGAVYREHVTALPSELSDEQQLELVYALVEELAGDRPYQFAIHAPLSSLSGQPNPHVHLMTTDRQPDGIEREPEYVFRRYNAAYPARGGWRKLSGGRTQRQVRDELIAKRKRCAELQNEALARYGHGSRVDHRTLSEQGIQRDAEKHLGQARVRSMSGDDRQDHMATRRIS